MRCCGIIARVMPLVPHQFPTRSKDSVDGDSTRRPRKTTRLSHLRTSIHSSAPARPATQSFLHNWSLHNLLQIFFGLSVLFSELFPPDGILVCRRLRRYHPDLVRNLALVLVLGCRRCCLDRRNRSLQPLLQDFQASFLAILDPSTRPSWAES